MDAHKISQEITIDDRRYKIMHSDPEEAFEIGTDLLKLVGEPLGAMAIAGADAGDGEEAKRKALEGLPKAIKLLLGNIEAKKLLMLAKRMFKTVEYQGEVGAENKKQLLNSEAAFKVHFQGRHELIIKLLAETIAFQQEAFFKAVMDGIAAMMTKVV